MAEITVVDISTRAVEYHEIGFGAGPPFFFGVQEMSPEAEDLTELSVFMTGVGSVVAADNYDPPATVLPMPT